MNICSDKTYQIFNIISFLHTFYNIQDSINFVLYLIYGMYSKLLTLNKLYWGI